MWSENDAITWTLLSFHSKPNTLNRNRALLRSAWTGESKSEEKTAVKEKSNGKKA